METPYGGKVTGEPRDTETVMRGSERGRWKSTRKGNSLAAYSTARMVLRGRCGGDVALLPDYPEHTPNSAPRSSIGLAKG